MILDLIDKNKKPSGGQLVVHIMHTSPSAVATVLQQAHKVGQELEEIDLTSSFLSLVGKVNVLVKMGNSISKVQLYRFLIYV